MLFFIYSFQSFIRTTFLHICFVKTRETMLRREHEQSLLWIRLAFEWSCFPAPINMSHSVYLPFKIILCGIWVQGISARFSPFVRGNTIMNLNVTKIYYWRVLPSKYLELVVWIVELSVHVFELCNEEKSSWIN